MCCSDPRNAYRNFLGRRFEVYELIRKLILVGIITFVMPDTVTQIAVGCFVSISALCVHLCLRPFKNATDNEDQALALIAITITLYAALLLSTNTTSDEWQSIKTLTTVLIIVNVAAVCVPPARIVLEESCLARFPSWLRSQLYPGAAAAEIDSPEEQPKDSSPTPNPMRSGVDSPPPAGTTQFRMPTKQDQPPPSAPWLVVMGGKKWKARAKASAVQSQSAATTSQQEIELSEIYTGSAAEPCGASSETMAGPSSPTQVRNPLQANDVALEQRRSPTTRDLAPPWSAMSAGMKWKNRTKANAAARSQSSIISEHISHRTGLDDTETHVIGHGAHVVVGSSPPPSNIVPQMASPTGFPATLANPDPMADGDVVAAGVAARVLSELSPPEADLMDDLSGIEQAAAATLRDDNNEEGTVLGAVANQPSRASL